MHELTSKTWWHAAGIRALKTICQTAIATVPTTALVLNEVPWLTVISAALLAGVLSILTSLAGLPEVTGAGTGTEITETTETETTETEGE